MKRPKLLRTTFALGLLGGGLWAASPAIAAISTALSVGSVENLGSPAGFQFAYGLSSTASGTVAGYGYRENQGDGSPWGYRAVRSVGGAAPVALPLPSNAEYPPYIGTSSAGYAFSFAFDIAETGAAAGYHQKWYQPCANCGYSNTTQAAIWDAAGSLTVLPPGYVRSDGWSYAYAERISPNGQYVVGNTYFSDLSYRRVRWSTSGGAPIALAQPSAGGEYVNDVNDVGVAVGYSYDGSRYRAARWSTDGQAITLLDDLILQGATAPVYGFAIAYGVLADGSAVGYQNLDPDGSGPLPQRTYAVRWDAAGTASDISPDGATYALAYDANEAGVTLFYACLPTTGCAYYLSSDGDTPRRLDGGWIGHTDALSESSNGTSYVAGYVSSGGYAHMARWKVSTAAANAAPVVTFASATVTTTEGTGVLLAPVITDDDGPAPYTYEWDVTDNGVDDFVAGAASRTFTPTDNGSFPIRMRVIDGLGAVSEVASVTVEATNVAPTATFRVSAISVPEGTAFGLTLSSPDDPSSADLAAGFGSAFDCGNGLGAFSALSTSAPFTTSCATTDNGTRATYGAIRDKDGGTATYGPVTVTVINVAPTVSQLLLPAAPVAINTTVSATATYSDPGVDDTHTAAFTWDWDLAGDAAATGAVVTTVNGAGGSAASTTSYPTAGVYTVQVAVADDDAGEGTRVSNLDVPAYVVVYDPSAGFVTGGGWILSPAGACRLASCTAETSGKATFGFVSRYKKGANVPDGNTEFEFAAGGLRFKSTSYQWLVVSGARGQYKGEGTVNGSGRFGFLLTAIDGHVKGGGGTDRFRIKIWEKNADGTDGAVVYDNQMDAPDDSSATTALGGGSIVIHAK